MRRFLPFFLFCLGSFLLFPVVAFALPPQRDVTSLSNTLSNAAGTPSVPAVNESRHGCCECHFPDGRVARAVTQPADGREVEPTADLCDMGLIHTAFVTLGGWLWDAGSAVGATSADSGTTVTPTSCRTVDISVCQRLQFDTTRPILQNSTEERRSFQSVTPVLSVPLPGVTISPATQSGDYVTVPFLAQYITGIYRFAVGIGTILAAIMMVYGGFRYLLAASIPEIKNGKATIINAVVGLVVLLTSYVILRTINPALVTLQPLRIKSIRQEIITHAAGTINQAVAPGETPACAPGRRTIPASATNADIPMHELGMRHIYVQFFVPENPGSSAWGLLEVSPRLAQNQSPNPCLPGAIPPTNPNTTACRATFANYLGSSLGSAMASYAMIMSYYGVQTSASLSIDLATNGNVPPGTVKTWTAATPPVLVGLSQLPQGPTVQSALRVRAQLHLFDPIDSAILAISANALNADGVSVNAATFFGRQPGFAAEQVTAEGGQTRSAKAAALLRDGKPLILYCKNCDLKNGNMGTIERLASMPGQYYVIRGVTQESDVFSLIDSRMNFGSQMVAYIQATEIDAQNTGGRELVIYNVHPDSSNSTALNAACQPPGGGPAQVIGSQARAGSVTRTTFDYRPVPSDTNWAPNEAQLIFPDRLRTAFAATPRPKIRLFIFLPGANASHAHSQTADYTTALTNVLGEFAGSRDIVIATPHYMGNGYMNRFDLHGFYDTAKAALAVAIHPSITEADIQDVVVGGFGEATCMAAPSRTVPTPAAPILERAFLDPLLRHQVGIIAYDGCAGSKILNIPSSAPIPLGIESLTPQPMKFFINADLLATGDTGKGLVQAIATDAPAGTLATSMNLLIRDRWHLQMLTCPTSVAPGTAECFAPAGTNPGVGNWMLFETHVGHTASIGVMTRIMFQAFYAQAAH